MRQRPADADRNRHRQRRQVGQVYSQQRAADPAAERQTAGYSGALVATREPPAAGHREAVGLTGNSYNGQGM